MNDDDKIFRQSETRDASRMREWNENSERMLRKTNRVTEKNDQKTEKNDRENEEHKWRKHLNKNNDQTVDDRDFNAFIARDQRLFKTKIEQRNEINDMN